ncbi:MAG: hypothetical protein IT299_01745 [Dehalococcoidia bacterium]|nr:hypothetical protein [Dehalococcoidia bacterium]
MRVKLLVLAAASLLALQACGASIRNDARPITTPRSALEGRTAAATPSPVPPAPGSMLAAPEPAGPGGAADLEGASVRALEYLGELLSVPVRELRVESVLERPGVGGWRVVIQDAFRQSHTLDVTQSATSWLGETREEGVLVARDPAQRVIVVQAGGRPLTLRLPASGTARVDGVAVGTPVAFAYDVHPRGDGTLVLAWLEPRP